MEKVVSNFEKLSHIPNSVKVGLLSAILAQPFEVIRTCSIINQHNITNVNFRGMIEICRKIFQKEGYKGFFRGSTLSFFKITLNYTFFFLSLDKMIQNVKPIANQSNFFFSSQIADFAMASSSKAMTTILFNPINMMKTRFEVLGNNEYKSIFSAVCKIYKKEGISGFYKGTIPSLMKDVPYSGLQYSLYQSIMGCNERIRENKIGIVIAAGLSSSMAIMITYPFDNLRVRAQFNQGSPMKMLGLIKEIFEKEGIKGFYKGYLPRLIKKIFGGAITWSIYEFYKPNRTLKKEF
jgi:Mitochondrial carrier protein